MKKVAALVMVFTLTALGAPAQGQPSASNAAAEQATIASSVEDAVNGALAKRDATQAAATTAAAATVEVRRQTTYGWGAILGIGLAAFLVLFLLAQMLRGSMIAGVAQSSRGGGIVVMILLIMGIGCAVLWAHGSGAQGTAVPAAENSATHLPAISTRMQIALSLVAMLAMGFPVYLGLLVDTVRWLLRRLRLATK